MKPAVMARRAGTSAGTAIGLASLGLGVLVWLNSRKAAGGGTGVNGVILQFDGFAFADTDRVNLEVVVESQASESRLFEVAWSLTHQKWQRVGTTLMREVPAGQMESYALLELTPSFKRGERITVELTLYSRALSGGAAVQDDSRQFELVGGIG